MYRANIKHQSGMTLIEIAIAILIVGVMLGAALQLYNQNRDQFAKKITDERMDYIVRALSTYAETNNRIPCPADPSVETARVAVTPTVGREPWRFGYERGITVIPTSSTPANIGNCTAVADQNGLVPFQTLGIPSEYAKDGWGNYFTYAVSPVFTQRSDFADTGTNNDKTHQVHEQCRTQGWIVSNYPANAPKARFCCARDGGAAFNRSTDLVITNKDNTQTVSPTRDDFGTRYGTMISTIRNGSSQHIPAAGAIEAPAFVLVSHGSNGLCSFLANDTANRKGACNHSTPEIENNNANQTYNLGVATPQTAGGVYDDIVVWMTQFDLMAYNGGSSCSLP
jgi:prepilin-type N-terminal cleavage/methylation domain-containing protein